MLIQFFEVDIMDLFLSMLKSHQEFLMFYQEQELPNNSGRPLSYIDLTDRYMAATEKTTFLKYAFSVLK